MIPISKITKELDIKPHQLREWEKRGWLGTEKVIKDPDNNGQRIYNEEQIERIRFINEEIIQQKKKGITRTDIAEMDAKLLDKFGGEVTPIEKKEIMIHTTSVEDMTKLIIDLSKKVSDLEEKLSAVDKKTDQVLKVQEEERKRILERDQELLNALEESRQAKIEAATTKKKSFFQRLFNK